jgi:hypothetical protein
MIHGAIIRAVGSSLYTKAAPFPVWQQGSTPRSALWDSRHRGSRRRGHGSTEASNSRWVGHKPSAGRPRQRQRRRHDHSLSYSGE